MQRDMAKKTQREEPTSRAASRALTIDEIIGEALAIADTEGLHSLTIRRLAAKTNLGAMTLYNYFSSKNDLLQNMADYVLSRFEAPTGKAADVKEYIRLLTHAWHRMMINHPTIVQLILQQVTSRPAARRASFETPIRDLCSYGLSGEQAVRVYGYTVTYALGFTAYQLPRPWGFESDTVPDVDEQRRQQSLLIQSLSIHEYPTMVAHADLIVSLPTMAQFDWGIEVFLAGFETWIAQTDS